MIISRSVLLKIKKFQTEILEKIKNTYFVFNNIFFKSMFYEIMCKNVLEWDRPQVIMWRKHIARWMPKATD